MHMNEELHKLARGHLISYFGVADLSKIDHAVVDQSGTGLGYYPYCITMGIALPDDVVNRLPYREQYSDALNYRLFAYNVINQRLDLAASVLCSFIQEKGFGAFPIPSAERVDQDRIYGAFSHKLGARLCGFGWIGKSCLLITPDNGPRVRWVSVLTDAPLQPTGKVVLEEQCGECTVCTDICPANAIKNRNFDSGEQREMRFDARKCEAYFDSLTASGKLDICGMCLYACPYGRKQRDSGRQY